MAAFGWPGGPLQLVDEVGLEVAGHAGDTVAKTRGLTPPTIVNALVAEGFKGKHKGGGFYRYEGHRRAPSPPRHDRLPPPPRRAWGDIPGRPAVDILHPSGTRRGEGAERVPGGGDPRRVA